MAISSPSTVQVNGAVWAQLAQQQAQRAADQAERTAQSLQLKAREAQTDAERAQDNARSLKAEHGQAENKASHARDRLNAFKAIGELQQGLQLLREKIAPSTTEGLTSSSGGVVNSSGQQTGTLLDVTA